MVLTGLIQHLQSERVLLDRHSTRVSDSKCAKQSLKGSTMLMSAVSMLLAVWFSMHDLIDDRDTKQSTGSTAEEGCKSIPFWSLRYKHSPHSHATTGVPCCLAAYLKMKRIFVTLAGREVVIVHASKLYATFVSYTEELPYVS